MSTDRIPPNRLAHLYSFFSSNPAPVQPAPVANTLPRRFILWVDGVGGFLACLNDELTVGQADPGTGVGIPIVSDISRQHARIIRRDGDYLVEPRGDVQLRGKTIRQPTLLMHNDEITLGNDTRLHFQRPHPLSSTARLNLLSPYRTDPRSDAILLVSQTLMLGNNSRSHVVCPEWDNEMVLFQQDQQLFCRSNQPLEVDGSPLVSQLPIHCGQRLRGENCAVSLEEV